VFKDHLVEWVNKYLKIKFGKAKAAEIIEDIDHRWALFHSVDVYHILIHLRLAAIPSFPGIRRFPDGRGFSQWTGDDSKALMKVGFFFEPCF
jgi:hypothetical protein